MPIHVLGLSLALDERGIAPGIATRVNLVAEVTALASGVERARPPLSVVLAVDVSGSMAGPPIEQVIQSIDRLIALLEPTDHIGVVAFSDSASEVVRVVPATAQNRRLISARTHRLVAEGGTNIEAGLRRAAAMMPPRGPHERQVILLLSDGAPNRGAATAPDLADLARSLRPDVSVSTLGYGAAHQEDLLTAVSEAGAGRYHFIADPSVCALEFAQAIGTQGDVVAQAIEIAVALEPGVEIVRFLGKPRVRFGASGLRVDIPDLLEGMRHVVVAELGLSTPREPGSWKIARATLSYQRAGERETQVVEEVLTTVVGFGDRVADPEARARVLLVRVEEARAEARALADRAQYDGAAAVLRRLITEIQAEPWFHAGDGSPLAEALEQIVDEAVTLERRPNVEQYRAFRKTQLNMPMASEAPRSVASPMSMHAMSSVAGVLPKARLVFLSGAHQGEERRLTRPKAVIGRTPHADIQVATPDVSRQHAMIVGQNGRFLVMDLKSSNPTQVNGQVVDAPRPLSPGDVIRVGDIELRYEEDQA
ncbi:MAG: VWA domain-containing protein [Minicystis sp.]